MCPRQMKLTQQLLCLKVFLPILIALLGMFYLIRDLARLLKRNNASSNDSSSKSGKT